MGEAPSSAPNGGTWTQFFQPSVARVGTSFDVAFAGGYVVNQTGQQAVIVQRGVTTPSSQSTTLITTENEITIPGLGSDLDIVFASQGVAPSISESGGTAFNMFVKVSGQNRQVLMTKGPLTSDPLRVVSFDGMSFSGSQSGTMLQAAVPFALAPNGDVGFRASTFTTASNKSGVFLWNALNNNLQLIIHSDDQAPGTNDSFIIIADATNGPNMAEFGDAARSAFRATTTGLSAKGIWVDHPVAGLTRIADTQEFANGVNNPPLKFADFHGPAVSSLGAVAFRACLPGGATCSNDGIWSGPPGSVALVTRQGDPAPDPTGVATSDSFAEFSDPVLNEAGAIAFRGQTGGYQGIWRKATQFGPQLKRVVKQGDFLRGTSHQFVSFLPDMAIADSGEIAFVAIMSDSQKALLTTSQIGTTTHLVKIVKAGEAFVLPSSGQSKLIQDILFHPGAYQMGATGFVHVSSVPAQPQAVAFAIQFPSSEAALVLTTVE